MSLTGKPARYILAVLLLLLPAARASAVRVERLSRFSIASGQASHMEVAAGSALVKFKAGTSTSAAAAALQPSGFSVSKTFEGLGWSLVSLPGAMSVAIGLDALKSLPQIEAVEPNKVYRVKRAPNDAYASLQYALSKVQAFGAWEYETGVSSRVTVAVMDTGIDGTHPETFDKLVGTSRAFHPTSGAPSDNQPPTPACNHATRVAGVAAALSDNSSGVAGMSWGAKLISLKIFADSDCTPDCSDEAGLNSCGTSDAAMTAAIQDVIPLHNTSQVGKLVINMSIGCPFGSICGSCGGALQAAVTAANTAGVLLIAAAGNGGIGFIDSPANCAGVYAVGATDMQDKIASFSNSDTLMMTKGLAAPGVELYTTDINGGYASATGTSFSSPMAAGLAALVWSAKPSLTNPADVFDIIKNSADDLGAPGPDRDYGYGRINAYRAICSVVSCPSYTAGTKKASAYPNPFRPASHRLVAFKTAPGLDTSGIEIKIYTSEGELVKKLPGLAWDGRNEAGLQVASGVYIFRLKTDSDAAVGKFALIR